MKHILTLFIGVLFLVSCATTQNGSSSKQKDTFTVHGRCGMCKTAIEGELEKVPGVYWSDWEQSTNQLTVKYDPSVVEIDDMQKKLAAIGYDSDNHRATDEAYDALHGCCKYERP